MQVNPKITFFVPDFENPINTSFISSEIKAGFPSPAADFEESKVSLDHLLIKNKEATFYAKASGNSMIGAGIDDGDIMRTYNRTKFDSRGGFIWRLEPEYVINQYDMDDNFIESFKSPSEACKKIECNSFHHILTCYRGHSQTYMGYKWKLEKNNYGKK